jgi:TRAP-type C4-dicarboxylate transport system permease small subunit
MHNIIKKASKALENISLLFLILLFACVLVQIIMRNFFNSGSVVLEELARFSLVSLVFLMIPVLIIDKQHIIVDLLTSRLPKTAKRVFEIIIEGTSFLMSFFLLFSVNQVISKNWSVRTPAMRMPNFIMYIPIVLGITFSALASLLFLIKLIRNGGDSK